MAGNLLNQLFQRRKPGCWRPIQLIYADTCTVSPSHTDAGWQITPITCRCNERWSSVFCEGKNWFVLVGVAESVTLGWWGLSLALCPEPTHKHAFSASRDEEHRVKECGDEEGHEQAVRGGNREKTDAAERKKTKDKVEWRASCFSFYNYGSAKFPRGRCFQLLLLLLFR